MASSPEIIERQRNHLGALLKIKKNNPNITVACLQELICESIIPMTQEDIAWVEKIVGVKAIDN
jgi:hypothetical protein